MTEKDMEDILWNWPEEILDEHLTRFLRQLRCSKGRLDLLFEDSLGRLLVIELKQGKLPDQAIAQVTNYANSIRERFPSKDVRCMVLANEIPASCRSMCEEVDVEWREVSKERFQRVTDEGAVRGRTEPRRGRSHTHNAPASEAGSHQQDKVEMSERTRHRTTWREQGYGGALLVIDRLSEIVTQADSRLVLHTNEVMDGKKARMFSKIGFEFEPAPFESGINSNRDLLRAELHLYDSVRLSVHVKNHDCRKAWEAKLKNIRSGADLGFSLLPPRVGHGSEGWLRFGDLSLRDIEDRSLRACLIDLIADSFREWVLRFRPGESVP